MDGDTLVFVEVKLRSGSADPLEAIDASKRDRLSSVALDFLARQDMLERAARFDVVAVDGDTLVCTHIADAFDCAIPY